MKKMTVEEEQPGRIPRQLVSWWSVTSRGSTGGCSGEANRVVDGPDHDWPVGCALRCFDTSCWLLEGVYQVEPSVQDGMFWED